MHSRHAIYQHGFTLLELIVTISIAAILLSFAIPSTLQLIRNNQMTSSANDLVSNFHYARSEAIRRGLPIGICSSADQQTCNGTANWSNGWITWVDTDNDNAISAGEEITFHSEAMSSSLSMNNMSNQISLRYLPTGYLAVAPGANLIFQLCDNRVGETGRSVRISATGNPSVTSLPCS